VQRSDLRQAVVYAGPQAQALRQALSARHGAIVPLLMDEKFKQWLVCEHRSVSTRPPQEGTPPSWPADRITTACVSQVEHQTLGRHHRDARVIYSASSNLLNEFGKFATDLHKSNQQQK